MGQQFKALSEKHIAFINQQKIFFVGTASHDSRVNISPKGMDSFHIIDQNRIAWLNVTGSGNETSAHIQQHPRMTIMFTAFEGNPLTLRLYGSAKVIHHTDKEWEDMYSLFKPLPGARQIFDLSVEMVQNSCGMSIPFYDYAGERDQLTHWAKVQGDQGIKQYWENKNQLSIDGEPTNILDKNT
ncbi:MAG: pyridoxamine 5'-phosphate oxidase family protein [Agarilytica sp.]